MKKSPLLLLALMLVFSTANIQCNSASKLLSAGSPLMSMLGGQPNLSSIASLLQTPGLGKSLGGLLKNPFTLLAPTNDALQSLGTDALANLAKPENLSNLAGLLKNHLIPGKQDAAALTGGNVTSAAGKALSGLTEADLGSAMSSDDFNVIPVNKVLGQ